MKLTNIQQLKQLPLINRGKLTWLTYLWQVARYIMTVNKEVTGEAKVSVVVQGQKGEAAIYIVTCHYARGPEVTEGGHG